MIYTSIIGDRDKPRHDIRVCTDNRWFKDKRMAAKMYKILPHIWWKENSIWIDGNIDLKITEAEAMDKFLNDADLAVFRHPFRANPFEEMECCAELKLDEPVRLEQYLHHFGEEYLKSLPLHECNVIVRRNCQAVNQFNEHWWALICRWSNRDQLTFPIAVAETGIKVTEIDPPQSARSHPDFVYRQHA